MTPAHVKAVMMIKNAEKNIEFKALYFSTNLHKKVQNNLKEKKIIKPITLLIVIYKLCEHLDHPLNFLFCHVVSVLEAKKTYLQKYLLTFYNRFYNRFSLTIFYPHNILKHFP